MEKSIHQLTYVLQQGIQTTLTNLSESVASLHKSLELQAERVAKISDAGSKAQIDELKKDVQSVKGLLLSSNRFPSNPPVQPPSIPSWQLSTSSSSSDQKSDQARHHHHQQQGDPNAAIQLGQESRSPDLLSLKSATAVPTGSALPGEGNGAEGPAGFLNASDSSTGSSAEIV